MYGIVCMTIAIALLSTMDALAKWLSTHGVSVIQILAIRSVVIIPLLLIVYQSRNQLAELKPKRLKLQVWRGAIGFLAPFSFFLGIQKIPLTDAVALFFSSTFIITILSVIFLGEKVGLHRWASIFLGFIGVLIVASPQGGGQLSGYFLVLLGSTAYAILFISGRYLSATETVASLVFTYNVIVGVISLTLLPWFWQAIQLTDIYLLVVLSLFAVGGHYFITMAFSASEASLVAPFEYTGILWAISFDLIIWHTTPTLTTGLGASVIIASGLYIVHRERLLGAKLMPPEPHPDPHSAVISEPAKVVNSGQGNDNPAHSSPESN